MVLDGVLLVQKLLKLFPLDSLCVPYKHNELAAILRGEFSKTVLPYTKIDRGLRDGQQPFFTERNRWNRFFGVCITARQGTGITIDVRSEAERSDKRGGVHINIGAHRVFLLED